MSSTDTRTLRPAQLFVALAGPNFDGNDFIAAAADAGAAGASSVERSRSPRVCRRSSCADTLAALERAARAWRAQFAVPLVGVAGSNGKTTVKEMIAAILVAGGRVPRDAGNLNNHIGVPLDAAAPRAPRTASR